MVKVYTLLPRTYLLVVSKSGSVLDGCDSEDDPGLVWWEVLSKASICWSWAMSVFSIHLLLFCFAARKREKKNSWSNHSCNFYPWCSLSLSIRVGKYFLQSAFCLSVSQWPNWSPQITAVEPWSSQALNFSSSLFVQSSIFPSIAWWNHFGEWRGTARNGLIQFWANPRGRIFLCQAKAKWLVRNPLHIESRLSYYCFTPHFLTSEEMAK